MEFLKAVLKVAWTAVLKDYLQAAKMVSQMDSSKVVMMAVLWVAHWVYPKGVL